MARFGLSAFLLLAACGSIAPNNPAAEKRSVAAARAEAARLRRACGSQDGYDRLKALAFAEARRIRRAEPPALKQLASLSVVRMDRPVAVSRDDAMGVTVCRGRLVLELPQGAEDVFDGDRRLDAEIEYSAQDAADGSGPVYQMRGAEPIIYRLAAVDLRAREPAPLATPTGVAAATRAPPMAPAPVEAVRPSPVPTPALVPKLRSAPTRVAARPKPRPTPTRAAARAKPTKAAARPASRPKPVKFAARPAPKLKSIKAAARPATRRKPLKVAAVPTPRRKPVEVAARPAPRPTPARVAARPAPRPTPVRSAPRPAPAKSAVRPNSRCDYARSRVDRLVCEDPRLARADRAVSAEFQEALSFADPYARRDLLRTRDAFLAYRDRCPSAGCVLEAYADRIEEIRDIAADR